MSPSSNPILGPEGTNQFTTEHLTPNCLSIRFFHDAFNPLNFEDWSALPGWCGGVLHSLAERGHMRSVRISGFAKVEVSSGTTSPVSAASSASGPIGKADVCLWHIADMPLALTDVCFWGQSADSD